MLDVGLRNTSSENAKNSAIHQCWTIADITSIPRSPNQMDWRIEPHVGNNFQNNPVSFTGQEYLVSWKSDVNQAREADVC